MNGAIQRETGLFRNSKQACFMKQSRNVVQPRSDNTSGRDESRGWLWSCFNWWLRSGSWSCCWSSNGTASAGGTTGGASSWSTAAGSWSAAATGASWLAATGTSWSAAATCFDRITHREQHRNCSSSCKTDLTDHSEPPSTWTENQTVAADARRAYPPQQPYPYS